MIIYILLLITRIATLIPITIVSTKLFRRFKLEARDRELDKTATGMSIISVSLIVESLLFGVYDVYRLFNFVENSSPLWLIILWIGIRVTLVVGVIILFSILFEEE